MITIKLFPAGYGDCVLLSIGESGKNFHMLIDGGVTETYSGSIKQELQEIRSAGEKIDLVVCTHMDNDHISGLVKMLKDHNADVIGNVWYNGFLQIIEEKFYLKRNVSNNEGCLADQKILDHIIRQGMISDEQQMVGINEGMSFGVLLEKEKLPVNEIVEGCAISTDNLQHKISINKDTAIYLIGPSKMDLDRVENYWKTDMIARNYRFRVSNQIKLTEAFEYQLERIQNFYAKEKTNVSQSEDLEKYMGKLTESDESIVNKSSIAFILEHNKKYYLFPGDAVMNEEMLDSIQKVVGYQHRFAVIKLPHHGSRYNITREFINRYTAMEYYCLTDSKRFAHPDLEVMASILGTDRQRKTLIFNYPVEKAAFLNRPEWKQKYNYEIITGDGVTSVRSEYS